jgi:parallel beta-helix repeat protein
VFNVTVKNLVVANNYEGIGLTDSSNVIIANNTITGTRATLPFEQTSAISVIRGTSNVIIGNNFVNNMLGVFLGETSNNLIVGNNITGCSGVALDICYSSDNSIYHNNFINNSQIAYPNRYYGTTSLNTWDDGYPSGGNYYSDYQTKYPNATMIDGSGIGDTPYVIDANNKDNYPLMASVDNVAPNIEVVSPENKTYNTSSIPLNFTVNEAVTQITYSLNGDDNIPITGNTTLNGLPNGDHNLTVYAKDEAGNVGSETTYFSVDAPFPTTLVVVASGAAVAIIGVGLLVYFKKRKRLFS